MPGPYFPDPAAEVLRSEAFDSSAYLANENGNVLELLKYVTESAGRLSVRDFFRSDPTYDSSILINPVFLAQVSPAGAVSFRGAAAAATAVAQVTHTLDAAAGLTYYSSNGVGTAHTIRQTMATLIPYGGAGVLPTFHNPDEYRYPVTSLTRKFVMEWYGKIAIEGDSSGFGISNSTAQISSNNFIAINRVATNKWSIVTAAAGIGGGATEATGTADNNPHLFRFEWYKTGGGTITVDLYVDDVFRLTATGGPDMTITNQITNWWMLYSPASNVTADSLRFYASIIYWKD